MKRTLTSCVLIRFVNLVVRYKADHRFALLSYLNDIHVGTFSINFNLICLSQNNYSIACHRPYSWYMCSSLVLCLKLSSFV